MEPASGPQGSGGRNFGDGHMGGSEKGGVMGGGMRPAPPLSVGAEAATLSAAEAPASTCPSTGPAPRPQPAAGVGALGVDGTLPSMRPIETSSTTPGVGLVRKASAVRVSGVMGGNASTLNGNFLPMDGKESGGRPVYKKGEVYIEYDAATELWQVKEKDWIGKGTTYMRSMHKCKEARVVEEVKCGWEVFNETSRAFEEQANVFVLPFAVCSISGCCRETWDSKEGGECCRTCKTSKGIKHGNCCDKRARMAAASALGSGDNTSAGRLRTFYHATNLAAALKIQDEGFRVPAWPEGTYKGRLGLGIYCTTTLKKAFDYLKCKHGGIIFDLDVDLGKCRKLDMNDPLMKTWQQHGYDSAWHPTGAVNKPHEEKEEYCVKDPQRIKVVRPIAGDTRKLDNAGYEIVADRLVKKSG